jgi:hypothetical protein
MAIFFSSKILISHKHGGGGGREGWAFLFLLFIRVSVVELLAVLL